eukprot:SAG11_NODE_6808_length_1244_cov_1.089956_1_plen_40_part_00
MAYVRALQQRATDLSRSVNVNLEKRLIIVPNILVIINFL